MFPPGPIVRSAETMPGHRLVLRRAWGPGPTILWMGINPSYADANRDDPTVLRMIGFSYRWGFGSMSLVNWYSFVTPDPIVLRAWLKKNPWQKDNMDIVRKETQREGIICVAAWGNLIKPEVLDDMMSTFFFELPMPKWRCIGTTQSGAPTHPLARGRYRVPDSAVLHPWNYELPPEGYF